MKATLDGVLGLRWYHYLLTLAWALLATFTWAEIALFVVTFAVAFVFVWVMTWMFRSVRGLVRPAGENNA